MAKKIEKEKNERRRKTFLVLSIVSNFGLLIYFKYLLFFTDLINLAWTGVFDSPLKVANDILPIGLSFHTFQSVSYVIDVYKRKIKPETHLGIYSTYVLFFPQMVAGPIERFSTLGNELKKQSRFSPGLLKKAVPLILIGLFYKMVIADNCGEYVNYTYSEVSRQNSYNILLAIFLFCIQIYSDFFGYSLIAQGSAKLFGISLIDNFAFPFFSENIVAFWKKWHISLTSWFRDYVYIPLGGNKRSTGRYCFNILMVFGLSGLWHGAGLNFILWGLLHAIIYLVFALFIRKADLSMPKGINYLITFAIVSVIFVFFRNGKLQESLTILKSVFSNTAFSFRPLSFILILNISVIAVVEYFAKRFYNYSEFISQNAEIKNALFFAYLLFAILTFSGVDNLPFIYFQF